MLTWDPIGSLHLIARCLFYPLVSLSMKLDAHLNGYFCPEKMLEEGWGGKVKQELTQFCLLSLHYKRQRVQCTLCKGEDV